MSNLVKAFSTFYDHGRRFVGVSIAQQDAMIATHATASYAEGVVTITAPGDDPRVYPVNKHYHRRAIVRWVAEFNKRAA